MTEPRVAAPMRPWLPMPRSPEPPPTPTPDAAALAEAALAEARATAAAAAYAEGLEVGRREGQQAGYTIGHRDGGLAMEAMLEARYDQELARVLGSFAETAQIWLREATTTRAGIEPFLLGASLEVAQWALGEPIAHDPGRLTERVRRVVALAGDLDRASLVLNPEDVAALQVLPSWSSFLASVPGLVVERDGSMPRGGVRIATPLHHLELNWADRLEGLREVLHRE